MKFVIFASALIVAACAGQPTAPATSATAPTTVVAKASQKPPAGLVGADGKINAEALANARKMGFTPVDKDGKVLYCRSDLVTGSHVARETVCMTLDEIESLREQTKQNMSNFSHQALPAPGH